MDVSDSKIDRIESSIDSKEIEQVKKNVEQNLGITETIIGSNRESKEGKGNFKRKLDRPKGSKHKAKTNGGVRRDTDVNIPNNPKLAVIDAVALNELECKSHDEIVTGDKVDNELESQIGDVTMKRQ